MFVWKAQGFQCKRTRIGLFECLDSRMQPQLHRAPLSVSSSRSTAAQTGCEAWFLNNMEKELGIPFKITIAFMSIYSNVD